MTNNEAAKILINMWFGFNNSKEIEAINKAVEVLKRQWIPVTEKLPEDHDWYLVVMKEKDTGYQCVPRVAAYTYGGKWDLIDSNGQCPEWLDNLECVAWMPLPEEYRNDGMIHIGDEVINVYGYKGYVTGFHNNEVFVLYKNGSIGHASMDKFARTGKRATEIAEVLRSVTRRMMEEENE